MQRTTLLIIILLLGLILPSHGGTVSQPLQIESEDGDYIVIEDIADAPTYQKRSKGSSKYQQGWGEGDFASSSSSSEDRASTGGGAKKTAKERRGERALPPLETANYESFSLLKDFEDMLGVDHRGIVDAEVMKELHKKYDDTKLILSSLRAKGTKEILNTPEEEENQKLVFDTIPKRLAQFSALSAEHKKIHIAIMESTVDALREPSATKAQVAMVKYCRIRLKQNKFASQKNIMEMLEMQREIRQSWWGGLTLLEWMRTAQSVWIFYTVFAILRGLICLKVQSLGILYNKAIILPILVSFVTNVELRRMAGVTPWPMNVIFVCAGQWGVLYVGDMGLSMGLRALSSRRFFSKLLSFFAKRRSGRRLGGPNN